MARGYTRIFSNIAYAARLPSSEPTVTIAAGMMRLVKLKVGSEGRVTDLTVAQEETDGTPYAFDIELLKSKIPYPLIDQDFSTATTPVDTVGLYRVIPTMSGAAGFPVEFDEQNLGYNYKNMDGSYTNNQQFLYLLIKPDSAVDETNWKISITVERNVGP